ncbi:uncharacterized protein METZ01_LOCUS162046 [marine metagenome]|jgi:hypothetical protein|uniref:Uncharacterized protein n=1 Tax=marine metagenome TaxID=408172 RepID=A0A382B7E3_9ZZZZ|tara:strand:- start:481 stop:690 length:210 start_codon:yes stop_codon:yes gene_type:complete
MSNDHLSRHRDSGRVVTEMTKRIEYKGKYAVRPLVKEEKGFYKEAEKKKIKPPKKLWNDGGEGNDSFGG